MGRGGVLAGNGLIVLHFVDWDEVKVKELILTVLCRRFDDDSVVRDVNFSTGGKESIRAVCRMIQPLRAGGKGRERILTLAVREHPALGGHCMLHFAIDESEGLESVPLDRHKKRIEHVRIPVDCSTVGAASAVSVVLSILLRERDDYGITERRLFSLKDRLTRKILGDWRLVLKQDGRLLLVHFEYPEKAGAISREVEREV